MPILRSAAIRESHCTAFPFRGAAAIDSITARPSGQLYNRVYRMPGRLHRRVVGEGEGVVEYQERKSLATYGDCTKRRNASITTTK